MKSKELNFDGLIGPTHNFGGLALGNLPSSKNQYAVSYPKKAALQGLEKMKQLHLLGIPQGIIPPQERPYLPALRKAGYEGDDQQILEKVAQNDFKLLLQCSSASSMWTANAATISPSADTQDRRVHITPANLISQAHRAIESDQTTKILKMIFFERRHFVHHPRLPNHESLCDEGAANHMRLTPQAGHQGVELFVYGRHYENEQSPMPAKFSARQTFEASKAVALTHQLDESRLVFLQQNPKAIDAGVFHNDLIATTNDNFFLYHEEAFLDKEQKMKEIQEKYAQFSSKPACLIEVKKEMLTMDEAVESFLFNSQMITLPDQSMILIAPLQCENSRAKEVINWVIEGDNPVKNVHYFDLQQSMANGGGPACLRLRVVLTEEEYYQIHHSFILEKLHFGLLEEWIKKYFRDEIHVEDLKSYEFLCESRQALDKLTQILNLGSIYSFQ
ncbi:MAG: N-succinylarginine dihydrolase [Candidatus Omnitrophica bacterium]|nr:N-succinylarginine dihydrolase [Candidatus Omnitrophota bacterium]MCB9747541.1 N-succinylarginine dihydrolase [Candidatus Omnitrophota bacterium]